MGLSTSCRWITAAGLTMLGACAVGPNFHRPAPPAAKDYGNAPSQGATERLRPVLMTATVATLGMLPAALHTGVGSDVQRGIATVVVGGLAISTVLTLVVLPSMYHVIEHWAERRHGEARWA